MACVSVHAIASPETASSPACLLAGKHAGVRVSSVDGSVDGLMNVYVRGLNTLRGDSQPLWIVDGAVIGSCVNQNLNSFYLSGGKTINGNKLPDYSGRSYAAPVNSFRWLNPYDIESIEILKDISATALYGMAGANGVVIVKTRRPASEKSNIWLNSNVIQHKIAIFVPTIRKDTVKMTILQRRSRQSNVKTEPKSYQI